MSRSAFDLITLLNWSIVGLIRQCITGGILEFPFIQFVGNRCFVITQSPLKSMFTLVIISFMRNVPVLYIQFIPGKILVHACTKRINDQTIGWISFIKIPFTKQVSAGDIDILLSSFSNREAIHFNFNFLLTWLVNGQTKHIGLVLVFFPAFK